MQNSPIWHQPHRVLQDIAAETEQKHLAAEPTRFQKITESLCMGPMRCGESLRVRLGLAIHGRLA